MLSIYLKTQFFVVVVYNAEHNAGKSGFTPNFNVKGFVFSSVRWKILLGFNCRNRLLLTGTPIQNSMAEVCLYI